MRLEVSDKIHEGHQGITKCRECAKQAVWWPGLSKQIQEMVENCRVCLQHKVNHPEPLNPTPFPEHRGKNWVQISFSASHVTT